LYKQLAIKKEIALAVACFYDGRTIGDTQFRIAADIFSDQVKLDIVRQEIVEILDKVLSEGVPDEELLRAKHRLMGDYVKEMDAGQVARALLAGDFLIAGKKIEKVNSFPIRLYSVDEKAIRRVRLDCIQSMKRQFDGSG